MLNREIKQLSFRTNDRTAIEISRHRLGIESRRHHYDEQIGARLLQAFEQGQRKIALEVALVEFIEDDRVDAFQVGIRKQPAREHALRDKS